MVLVVIKDNGTTTISDNTKHNIVEVHSSTTTSDHSQSTSINHITSFTSSVIYKPTSTIAKTQPSTGSTINTGTSTHSQLPSGSSLSSINSSDDTNISSFQWAGIVLVVIALVIMIVVIFRKCSGKKNRGTIRLKDEPDSPETTKFEGFPLENHDSPLNDMVDNNNSLLVNIIDCDGNTSNNVVGDNVNNNVIYENVSNVSNNVTYENNVTYDNDNNNAIYNSDESNDSDNSGSRIQSQPPMVQLNRISSANLLIDYTSPFEDTCDVGANGYLSAETIDNSSINAPSSTLTHELEMERQESPVDISPMNRMTLSDYNDYNDFIPTEPYPSFESQFPNPPERIVPK